MAETREPILSENLFFLTTALSRKLARQADEACGRLGLSFSHTLILMLVEEQPGIQPGMLARKVHLKPSTVTRLVQKLERRGLVEKESEGRATSIVCTTKGEELISDIEEIWRNLMEQKKDELGERYVAVLSEMISKAIEEV